MQEIIQKIPKKFQVVAEYLKTVEQYESIKTIAEKLHMKEIDVRCSISYAKKNLARQGVIIVNEKGSGYKVGDWEEFVIEVDKSCHRAVSHIASMITLVNTLKSSHKIDKDFSAIDSVLRENMQQLRVLFDNGSYSSAPDFISEIANSKY